MADSEEDWIKRRAYELWEAEGYPTGKDTEHWERAKLEYVSLKPAASLSGKSRRKSTEPVPDEKPTGARKAAASKVTASKTSSTTAKAPKAPAAPAPAEAAVRKRTKKAPAVT